MGAVHRSSVRQHSKPNRRWNDDEQAKLKELVEAAKESAKDPDKIRWSQIAAHIPDRTGKQCRERWLNHTRDGINKSKWTDVEEYRLAQLHCQFGTHWTSIAKQLLGRTENATKNHWTSSFRSKTAREPSFFADFVRELKVGRDKHEVFAELSAIYPHLELSSQDLEAHSADDPSSTAGGGADVWLQPPAHASVPNAARTSARTKPRSPPSPTSVSDPCPSSGSDQSVSDMAPVWDESHGGRHRSRRALAGAGAPKLDSHLRKRRSLGMGRMRTARRDHKAQQAERSYSDRRPAGAGTPPDLADQSLCSNSGPQGPNPFAVELTEGFHSPGQCIVPLSAFNLAGVKHQALMGDGSSPLSGPGSARCSVHASAHASGRRTSLDETSSLGNTSCSNSQYNPHRMEILPIRPPSHNELASTQPLPLSEVYDDVPGWSAAGGDDRQTLGGAGLDAIGSHYLTDSILGGAYDSRDMSYSALHAGSNHMDSAAGPRASDYDLMTMDDPLIGFKVPDNDHQISTGVDQRLGQPRGTIAHDSNHFIPLKGRCILTGGGRSPPGMPAMHPTMSRHTCPPDFFGGLDQHSTRSRGSGDGLQGATSAGAGMPGLQGGNKSGMHGGFHHALSEPMASAIAELQAQHQKRTVMERAAHEELAKQPGMSDLQALIGAYGSPALLDPKFHISSLPARLHHDGLLSHSHEQLLQRPSPFACDQGRSGHVGAGNGSPMGTMGLPPRMDRARSLNSASPHLQPPHRLSQQGTAPKRQCQGRSSSIISRSQSFPDEDLPRPATSPPLPPHQLPSCGSGMVPPGRRASGAAWEQKPPLSSASLRSVLQEYEHGQMGEGQMSPGMLQQYEQGRMGEGQMSPGVLQQFEQGPAANGASAGRHSLNLSPHAASGRGSQPGSFWSSMQSAPPGNGAQGPAHGAGATQQHAPVGEVAMGSSLRSASALANGRTGLALSCFADPFLQASFNSAEALLGSCRNNPFAHHAAADFAFCRSEMPAQLSGQHSRQHSARHLSRHLSEETLAPPDDQADMAKHMPLRHSAGAAFGSGLHMEEGLHSADPDATLPFGSVTLFPMRDRVGGGAGSGFSADPSNTVANASTPGKVSSDYWGPSASFSGCL